ncbi:MAG: DUF4956 domain-containing protein [Eubacteriales bacterium]
MSRTDILTWFSENSEDLSNQKILYVLCIGLLVASIIFITYRITYTGVSYSARFNMSNVIIVLITSVIMLMISSNITISLGMVGALSIVRYRTAIKDPHDIVYIFWSIVSGLCVGAQIHRLAIISVIFIAIVLVASSLYTKIHVKYLLIIRGHSTIDGKNIKEIIARYYPKYRVRTMNIATTHFEMICEVSAKGEIEMDLLDALKAINEIDSVNWLLESNETLG